MQYDVAVIGAGIAGMATALRLQAAGLTTVVLEAHGQPGGCAGYYRRRGFSFDVGATTLVDFGPDGVGGELLGVSGLPPVRGETLPGYVAWLPDRRVTLHRDRALWRTERLRKLGATDAHRSFWRLIDRLSDVFWRASRRGVKLPLRTAADVLHMVRCVGLGNLSMVRHRNRTMGDLLRSRGLRDDRALVGLLSMLIEDTVHSSVDDAPLINSAMGVTIRGAGLMRARGGMRGFWRDFMTRYRALGGELLVGRRVLQVTGRSGDYRVHMRKGTCAARQVVSALPSQLTAQIAPKDVTSRLRPYLDRDATSVGGACVVFLGVPEEEVAEQPFTHHQLLQDYDRPLGDGNNMFISVSSAGDTHSAPAGHRAVMISTHCELESWKNLSADEYQRRKRAIGARLIDLARRVYPNLGRTALVYEIGTPRTYQRFTGRPDGAVGGFRLNPRNANQAALPHSLGPPGFWLAGDTTWPGLGTVACVLGSRIVAEGVLSQAKRSSPHARKLRATDGDIETGPDGRTRVA